MILTLEPNICHSKNLFSQNFLPKYFCCFTIRDNVMYMSNESRAALTALTNALEEHLTAIINRRGEQDPSVDNAYVAVANAFERYEESLFEDYEEVTPLEVFLEEDDEDYDDFDEDDDIEFELDDED